MLKEKLKQLLEEKKDLVKQARQLIQEIDKDKEELANAIKDLKINQLLN
jgi:vacuolar-type H+-ATPase subunit D/Vma8